MNEQKRTARIAGLWYLGLALTGMLGFLLVRPAIHVAGDPAATLANLVENGALARLGVALELGIVLTQALAIVWFYKLFRPLNATAAHALAWFGLANAMLVLVSAAFLAAEVTVATDARLAPGGDVIGTTRLLFELSQTLWSVGTIFFGLWLIPMGYVAAHSGRMPKALGFTLIAGGVGYILNAFVTNGLDDVPVWLNSVLTLPAAVGEFWMIGYLLIFGIRPPVDSATSGL